MCEVAILSREIPPLFKTYPYTLLRSHLPSLPMDVFSGDYGNMCNYDAICATVEL